jgi:hypothetical protein
MVDWFQRMLDLFEGLGRSAAAMSGIEAREAE